MKQILPDTNVDIQLLQSNLSAELMLWLNDMQHALSEIDFSLHDYHPPEYDYQGNRNISAEKKLQETSSQVKS